jgi:hypothetical protein
MLDFMLYYVLCLELVEIQKRYFLVHSWGIDSVGSREIGRGECWKVGYWLGHEKSS